MWHSARLSSVFHTGCLHVLLNLYLGWFLLCLYGKVGSSLQFLVAPHNEHNDFCMQFYILLLYLICYWFRSFSLKASLFFYVIAAITCWGSNCPSLMLVLTWRNLKCLDSVLAFCYVGALVSFQCGSVLFCFRPKINPSQGVLAASIAVGLWRMQSLHFRCSWLGMAFSSSRKHLENMYYLEKKTHKFVAISNI